MKTLVTKYVLQVIEKLMVKQDVKGIEKYGVSLDAVPFDEYDWNVMAMEEMADGLKYLIMENKKLKRQVRFLVEENVKVKKRNQWLERMKNE